MISHFFTAPFFFFGLLHQILIGDIFRLNQQSYILIVVEGKTRRCAGAQKPGNVPERKNHVVCRGAKTRQSTGWCNLVTSVCFHIEFEFKIN